MNECRDNLKDGVEIEEIDSKNRAPRITKANLPLVRGFVRFPR